MVGPLRMDGRGPVLCTERVPDWFAGLVSTHSRTAVLASCFLYSPSAADSAGLLGGAGIVRCLPLVPGSAGTGAVVEVRDVYHESVDQLCAQPGLLARLVTVRGGTFLYLLSAACLR